MRQTGRNTNYENAIKTKRCAGKEEQMCQGRHFLSCDLIYGYWEHKSCPSSHMCFSGIHSSEHICENKLRNQKCFSTSFGLLRIPEICFIKSIKQMCLFTLYILQYLSLIQFCFGNTYFTITFKEMIHAKYN